MARQQGTRKEYARRLDRALQFIDRNLGGEITLSRLAQEASFSPFHFHRIFAGIIGEPPAEYIRRLRLEKAAVLLASSPERTVTDIALSCGFSTSALFSRLFRARFGVTPTRWRAAGGADSKNRQAIRKKGKAADRRSVYIGGMKTKKPIEVRVEDVPRFRVAYVKHMKGYEQSAGIAEAFQKLFFWAGPRGFLGPEMRTMGLSLDSPEVTPKDKCRYYACVAVDDRAEPDGEVGIMDIRAGKYAVARFKGGGEVFRSAYAYLYGEWLPGSGWQPDDAPAIESYRGGPEGPGGKERFDFDLLIPVRPLQGA